MVNHYDVLGVDEGASLSEIKRAFREKVKMLHPDITGSPVSQAMRRLLEAYKVLSDNEQRFRYDRTFHPKNSSRKTEFDYRTFLREHGSEPEYQAKLIFFDLFNFEEKEAVAVWQAAGGINFPLERFLDREDWMDCGFVLSEELERNGFVYEAFLLITQLLFEERKKPYFKHFTLDVEILLKDIVRLKLHRAVSDETWISCMQIMLKLGFSPKEEARWLKSIAETLYKLGDRRGAFTAFAKARQRDIKITLPKKMAGEWETAVREGVCGESFSV
ncbi:MAG: J domain-containing protein [Spirochaetaceae bacterium]|jgi:curved DNA-binding protein CbpA|nr:J domain-containing protein [Spirochaetaceae bacterium]